MDTYEKSGYLKENFGIFPSAYPKNAGVFNTIITIFTRYFSFFGEM